MTLDTTAARKKPVRTSSAPRQARKSAAKQPPAKKRSSKKSSAKRHLLADKRDEQLFALMCRLTSNGAHRLRTNHPSLATELGWSVSGSQYAVKRLLERGMIRKLAYNLGGYNQGTEYEIIGVSPGARTEAERRAHAATDALIAAANNRHSINAAKKSLRRRQPKANALPAMDALAAPAASDDAAPLEASELDAQRETAQCDDRLDERDLHEAYRLHRDRLIDAYLTDPQYTDARQKLTNECRTELIARLPLCAKLTDEQLQPLVVAAMRERLAAQSKPISITDMITIVRAAERVRAARLTAEHAGTSPGIA